MSDCDSESDGGDDEAPPEQLSFNSTRNMAEMEIKLVNDKKKKDKDLLKEKRRNRQDLFKKQKLEKETRLSKLVFTDAVLDQIRSEGKVSSTSMADKSATIPEIAKSTAPNINQPENADFPKDVSRPTRQLRSKTYKDLNIDVKSLNGIRNPRRETAINFRTKRFGKVHRESVLMNVIHTEKLKVSGKLCKL